MHISVMSNEVMSIFKPKKGEVFIDATFGRGGHTKLMLNAQANVMAVDRDIDAVQYAYDTIFSNQFIIRHCLFSELYDVWKSVAAQNSQYSKVTGVLFDVGLSSNQISDASRGFSFMKDGPLDMRMGCNERSALHIIQNYSKLELANLIYRYGEEGRSRLIANLIVNNRFNLKTTKNLADLLAKNLPSGKIHAATKVFQALRIAVNNELGELENGLINACRILQRGGLLVVITFHSLEDRIVKQFFKRHSLAYTKKLPISPSKQEILQNRRARSAKLRWAIVT